MAQQLILNSIQSILFQISMTRIISTWPYNKVAKNYQNNEGDEVQTNISLLFFLCAISPPIYISLPDFLYFFFINIVDLSYALWSTHNSINGVETMPLFDLFYVLSLFIGFHISTFFSPMIITPILVSMYANEEIKYGVNKASHCSNPRQITFKMRMHGDFLFMWP